VLKLEENRTSNPFRRNFVSSSSRRYRRTRCAPSSAQVPSRGALGYCCDEKAAPMQHHCDYAGVDSSITVFVN